MSVVATTVVDQPAKLAVAAEAGLSETDCHEVVAILGKLHTAVRAKEKGDPLDLAARNVLNAHAYHVELIPWLGRHAGPNRERRLTVLAAALAVFCEM